MWGAQITRIPYEQYITPQKLFLGGAASSHPLIYINSWGGADWCGLNLNNYFWVFDGSWVGKSPREPLWACKVHIAAEFRIWLNGSHSCTSSWCRLAAQVLLRGEWGGGHEERDGEADGGDTWVKTRKKREKQCTIMDDRVQQFSRTRLSLIFLSALKQKLTLMCYGKHPLVRFWGHFAPADWCGKH